MTYETILFVLARKTEGSRHRPCSQRHALLKSNTNLPIQIEIKEEKGIKIKHEIRIWVNIIVILINLAIHPVCQTTTIYNRKEI